jgi:hypothetical protein
VSLRSPLLGNMRRETDHPGQLCHDDNPSRINATGEIWRPIPAPVRPDFGEPVDEQRQFRGFG